MRLRRDQVAEIGVFEDLQTLIVILIGITILLASTLFNWSAFGSLERDQDLFDEAERLIAAVEAWDQLRAINSFSNPYPTFLLRQAELATTNNSKFMDQIKSDYNYYIIFDDLTIPDSQHNIDAGIHSYYEYGDPLPDGNEAVTAQVQYALVFEIHLGNHEYDVSERHACLMKVVVWQ